MIKSQLNVVRAKITVILDLLKENKALDRACLFYSSYYFGVNERILDFEKADKELAEVVKSISKEIPRHPKVLDMALMEATKKNFDSLTKKSRTKLHKCPIDPIIIVSLDDLSKNTYKHACEQKLNPALPNSGCMTTCSQG